MDPFWQGFLALPAIILGLALVAAVVFGAYLLAWKWWDDFRPKTWKPDEDDRWPTYPATRLATIVMLSRWRWHWMIWPGLRVIVMKDNQTIERWSTTSDIHMVLATATDDYRRRKQQQQP